MAGEAVRHPTVRQWAAARELSEGEFSTHPRLAAALGVTVEAVQERAARAGWRKVDFRRSAVMRAYRAAQSATDNPDGPEETLTTTAIEAESAAHDAVNADDGVDDPLGRLGRLLSRQAGLILTSAEAQHGILNKAQLDALSSLIRLAENVEKLAQERASEKQTRSDDEVAAVLERIDDRIVELAQGYAETLGAQKSDGG